MAEIPTPESQASDVRAVVEERLAEGKAWYVVSQRWWNLWAEHVGYEPSGAPREGQGAAAIPPIDNGELTLRPVGEPFPEGGHALRRPLLEQRDFVLIPEAAWRLLHQWYGGGPVLKRSVVLLGGSELTVELYPLQLTVYNVDSEGHMDPGSARTWAVSRLQKVKDAVQEILGPTHDADATRDAEGDGRLWQRSAAGAFELAHLQEVAGWEVVGPDADGMEDAGVRDESVLLLERREPLAKDAAQWPLFHRQRQIYRKSRFKDPTPGGPPLVVGDEIDAAEGNDGGLYSYSKKWYPASVVDEDEQRVLVQFQHRKPPPKKMPSITKDRSSSPTKLGWFSASASELSDETSEALIKVFDHYAKLDADKTHLDKKAIASLISCATNTICQQDDHRVSNMIRDHDSDKDNLLTVDDFLKYWASRAGSTNSAWLKDELQNLYKRARVDFGGASEEERLLQEGKEWIERTSDRLAAARTHVVDYPFLPEDRDFREFSMRDKVDMQVGKAWHAATVVGIDWGDYAVLVERNTASAGSSSGYSSYLYSSCSRWETGVREWLPIESERLAKFQTKSLGSEAGGSSPKSSTFATAAPTGVCEAPGACGLNNLGNTCFMNSTLQALSNTLSLRDYYRSGAWRPDICKCPLSMDGRLAGGFAEALDMLWSDTQKAVSPVKLKTLVSEKRPEFRGYQQHDAQELLIFLLDGLHEDGNRVGYPRPIVEDPGCSGKDDAQIAHEAWSGYLRRNSSRIVEIFQFQVRSEVTFPTVGEKSLTFDPMMYLSLPVPKPPHTLEVTVMPLGYPDAPPVRCNFDISKDKTFKDLDALVFSHLEARGRSRDSMSVDGQPEVSLRSRSAMIPEDLPDARPRCYVFADVYDNKVYKFFGRDRPVSEVRTGDKIWAFEVALPFGSVEDKHQFCAVHLRKRSKPAYPNSGAISSAGSSYRRFAPPQIIAVQPGLTSNAEVSGNLNAMAQMIKSYLGESATEVSLSVTAAYNVDEGTPLPEDGAGIFSISDGSVLALNFVVLEPASGAAEKEMPAPVDGDDDGAGGGSPTDVTLQQCLETFSACEELSKDDWVFCSKSGNFEKSLKKLDIWNSPEVLIIHLKRFGRERLTGPLEKIDTLVRFPMKLDLSPFVRGPGPKAQHQFALYATVNHSGGLGGGHYTAYARVGDGLERQWYHFNDSMATQAADSEVVSKASYILFYERVRNTSA